MKLLFAILIFIITIPLCARDPQVYLYFQNGGSIQYGIADLEGMGFLKSHLSFSMVIYQRTASNIYSDIRVTDSIRFDGDSIMKIFLVDSTISCNIAEIDSIIFSLNTCAEIQIGSQIWMCKNLESDFYRNGDPVPQVTDPSQWGSLTTGAWCYYNNDSTRGKKYGKLYNWYAVNDSRGLAPEGWHIPSDTEWTALSTYLGGANVAGSKLKEAGTTHWYSPNTGATNESGFTAYPGGYINHYGIFGFIDRDGYWWSSSEYDTDNAWYRSLSYGISDIEVKNNAKANGFSVRCIKDKPLIIPIIYSINPSTLKYGEIMTITGVNFGEYQDTNYVRFNDTNAIDYINWCDTLIQAKLPVGATTGKLWVMVYGRKSNEADFKVRPSVMPKIDYALVPAGTFQMGNTGKDFGFTDEFPVHNVTISRDLLMSKYEITQKQYEIVMSFNPSSIQGQKLPVDQVTWFDAVGFCNKLSALEELEPCYTIDGTNVECNWDAEGYRLPTEAEWEYACKSGTKTDFFSGDLTSTACHPIDESLSTIGWYYCNSDWVAHEVGTLQQNSFGLFDMNGNVAEWCWDWYGGYGNAPVTDPKGPESGTERVVRGGAWGHSARKCRSSLRYSYLPDNQLVYIGFRIIKNNNK